MPKPYYLIYALKNKTIVSVADVESGIKCGCVCPACGGALIAKKGNKRTHHFAHYSRTNCEYGYETSLHLAAKDILSKTKKLVIPPVDLVFVNSGRIKERLSEAKEIEIDKVELEKRFDSIIPDVVAYSGNKKFFIEIYVTHAIDQVKLEKIKNSHISTIEIDLSKKKDTISPEELADLLITETTFKKWVYNSFAERCYQRFLQVSDHRDIVVRGVALHVDYCPIKMREWRGKSYANFIDDCYGCMYCISTDETGILCSGAHRISSIKDFSS